MARNNKKSEFVSGAGTAFEIIQKLSGAVADLGGSDDDLRRLLSDKKLRGEVAKLLVGTIGRFVTVDTSLGFKGLLAALDAKDWTNGDILNPKWNPPSVLDRGTYEAEVELLLLGEDMTTAQIEAKVKAMPDYRLALPEETLAYCAKHKDAQREAPIVCVGAFWVLPFRGPRALVLDEFAGVRRVSLDWLGPGTRWCRRCRVAVVRK